MNRRSTGISDAVRQLDSLISCARRHLRRDSQHVSKLRALLNLLEAKRATSVGLPTESARRKVSR